MVAMALVQELVAIKIFCMLKKQQMENKSLWFQVLTHFDRNGYFRNGLTIPFLLGANSVINPQEERLTVEAFFEEIMDESLSQKISLQKCEYIGEYVIGIFDNESADYPWGGRSLYKSFGNLYITDDSFSTISGSHGIKAILIKEYQNRIDREQFSINERNWGKYSEIEISRLEELK
jgi:hypothetical protein